MKKFNNLEDAVNLNVALSKAIDLMMADEDFDAAQRLVILQRECAEELVKEFYKAA